MGGLIILGFAIGAIIVFDLLALVRGVDSRPGFSVGRNPGGSLPL